MREPQMGYDNLNKFVGESTAENIDKKCNLYLRLKIYLYCVTINL